MTDKHDEFDISIPLANEDLQELFEAFDPIQMDHYKAFLPENRLPIVLAHGIARPDDLINSLARTLSLSLYDYSLVFDRFHYFKGIASYLKRYGFEVYHSSVSFAAGVEKRARDLKREVEKILVRSGHDKVHIIAHSMGGLDARYMIVNEGMAEHVATLTTIGTPHLGSSVSDYIMENGVQRVVGVLSKVVNLEGIRSCSLAACAEFNDFAREVEAKNKVIYQTYASYQTREATFYPFQYAWKILDAREGNNDGLVSYRSQRWTDRIVARDGTVKPVRQHDFPMRFDHIDQIGWWNMNKVLKAGWWNLKALHVKNKHEQIIKNVYLKIANEVCFIQQVRE